MSGSMTSRMICVEADGKTMTATLEDNSSADALWDMLADGPMGIHMDDYMGMEKVGDLGKDLPRNDRQTKTGPGDIILYLGRNLVIYYDRNSWSFTRIGRVEDATKESMIDILGDGGVTVTLSRTE